MTTERVRALLTQQEWGLGVAESLTGGLLTNRFAVAEGASAWLRGGIVAYSADVKRGLLGIPDCPIVSRVCAVHMASAASRLLGAEVSVSTTGVGGPGAEDGEPPGTVWIAVGVVRSYHAERFHFPGDPEAVCQATCDAAVELLRQHLESAAFAS